MKRHLLPQTIILTLLTGIVNLNGGCAFNDENQEVICDPAVEGSCVVSYNEPDKNLAQDFAAYETAYLPMTNTAPGVGQTNVPLVDIESELAIPTTGTNGAPQLIAVSGPAETRGVSVQEKQAKQQLSQMQQQLNEKVGASVQQLGQTEADALNQLINQVTNSPVYIDQATGQYTTYPTQTVSAQPVLMQAAPTPSVTVQPVSAAPMPMPIPTVQMPPVLNQVVTTNQSFATQPGMLMGGNDLEDQIVVASNTKTAAKKTKTKKKKEKAVIHEEVEAPVMNVPMEQRLLFGEDVQDWNAPAGETLRSLLLQWGEQSGWTVVWKLDRDYALEAGVVFRGTFVEAASAFIRSFARATPAPIGTFYKGNRVLVINTQEGDNAH